MIELSDVVAQRLNDELVIWLNTVRADGTPQPALVWFWWDGEEFLIYSRPGVPKLANIAANPRVALNLNSIGDGGVAIFSGEARLDPSAPPSHLHGEYLPKYRRLIEGELGTQPESFAHEYSVAIRVRPTRLRAW